MYSVQVSMNSMSLCYNAYAFNSVKFVSSTVATNTSQLGYLGTLIFVMHAVRVQTTEDAEDLEIALEHDIVGGGPETKVHVLLGAT